MKKLNRAKKSRIAALMACLSMTSPIMQAKQNNDVVVSESEDNNLNLDEDIKNSEPIHLEKKNETNNDYENDETVTKEEIRAVQNALERYAKKNRESVKPIIDKFYKLQQQIIAAENQPTKKEILLGKMKRMAGKYLPGIAITAILGYLTYKLARSSYEKIRYGTPFFRSRDERVLNTYLEELKNSHDQEFSKRASLDFECEVVNTNKNIDRNPVYTFYVPGLPTMEERQKLSNINIFNNLQEKTEVNCQGIVNAVIFVGKGRRIKIKNAGTLKRVLIYCEDKDKTDVEFEAGHINTEYCELSSPGEVRVTNLPYSGLYVLRSPNPKVRFTDKGQDSGYSSLKPLNSWMSSGKRGVIGNLGGRISDRRSFSGWIGKDCVMYIQ